MHACLLIPEIVKLIFTNILFYDIVGSLVNFGDHYLQQVARRSLAALSRVCRSFKDLALDALWLKLDNLEPLFACLPRDLWTMTGDRRLIGWSSEQYASRVRILGITDSGLFGGIDAEFVYASDRFLFTVAAGTQPSNTLLQRLSFMFSIHVYVTSWVPTSFICCLFRRQKVFGPTSCLQCYQVSAGIHHNWKSSNSSDHMQCVLEPASLLSVGSRTCRRQLLSCQAAEICPGYLVSLVFKSCRSPSLEFLPPLRSQFRTSYLDKLVVCSFSLTSTGNEVAGWVVPCRQLQLVPAFPEIRGCLSNVPCACWNKRLLFDVLEHILLDVVLEPADHIDNAFTLQTFTPLMRFSGLKEIGLSAFCMSLLDDDALGSIVKSWPRLECLYLGTKCFWRTPPKITFRGLVALLSACPNLRNLGLVFDATKVDSLTAEKLGRGVCNTNITSFHVGFSPIEQPLQVAVSLSAVLPCLGEFSVESLLSRGPDRVAREAKWIEVLEHISHILTKKQESNTTGLEARVVTRRSTRKIARRE
ncbi:hypothetical protein F4604DRAFT_1673773 [Suillus subluteus]|nr:hypothetical protein F4604DRAFT_1673773 [Suillus subluteus]